MGSKLDIQIHDFVGVNQMILEWDDGVDDDDTLAEEKVRHDKVNRRLKHSLGWIQTFFFTQTHAIKNKFSKTFRNKGKKKHKKRG